MMEDLEKQSARFGTDIRWGIVTSVDFTKRPYTVIIDEKQVVEADTVIIATGATARYLGLESEEKYKGSGVSACATCDGFFYRGMVVAVVWDTALGSANLPACAKVYLIVRKDTSGHPGLCSNVY
jgi:thioredoxin reductase (NADPH)